MFCRCTPPSPIYALQTSDLLICVPIKTCKCFYPGGGNTKQSTLRPGMQIDRCNGGTYLITSNSNGISHLSKKTFLKRKFPLALLLKSHVSSLPDSLALRASRRVSVWMAWRQPGPPPCHPHRKRTGRVAASSQEGNGSGASQDSLALHAIHTEKERVTFQTFKTKVWGDRQVVVLTQGVAVEIETLPQSSGGVTPYGLSVMPCTHGFCT